MSSTGGTSGPWSENTDGAAPRGPNGGTALLATLAMAQFMVVLDFTIVNVALPSACLTAGSHQGEAVMSKSASGGIRSGVRWMIAKVVVPCLQILPRSPEFRNTLRMAVNGVFEVQEPPANLLFITGPSYAKSRLLRYSPEDPKATVGRYCSLNDGSWLLTGGEHHADHVSTSLLYHAVGAGPQWSDSKGPIVIGNDVWTGFGSVVLSGVTIGDGAVVGAGAFVTKDVEPYAVVGGVPAKFIRYRFDEPTRAALLRIRWWDWPEAKVRAHAAQLASPDVAYFISAHDPHLPTEDCAAC